MNAEVELTERNQDFCMVCKDGGILVCCDGCEKAVHAACIGCEQTPEVSTAWLLVAACPVGHISPVGCRHTSSWLGSMDATQLSASAYRPVLG